MTEGAQKTVLETILDWSQDRPVWQRDALRRILSKGHLDGAEIKELTDLCKQGRGAPGIALTPIPLEKRHLPTNQAQDAAVSLLYIAAVNGVNSLAPDQTLSFGPSGITIVYGDNGTGKSGYARILKRACRARHAGKIEQDVYAESPPSSATATIGYAIGGVAQPAEDWKDADQPHAKLSAISVFDSECASVHINEKNEVAFRPFGLDVPDELAGACQAVKEALTTEQTQHERSRNPIFARPAWKATTAVGKALVALKHDTDVRQLRALGTLGPDETARLARLREDLSKNPATAAAEQTLKGDNVKRLLEAVKEVDACVRDDVLLAVLAADRNARVQRQAARIAAEDAFSGEPLKGIGGEVWRSLWESARSYSTGLAYPTEAFPLYTNDARCVLCQQPLQAEALERMARFERFVRNDTEQRAQAAEALAVASRQALTAARISTRSLKANLQELAIQDPGLARCTRRFLAAARLRRYFLMKNFGGVEQPTFPDTGVPTPAADLGQLEEVLRAYAVELQKAATGEARRKLETDLAELNDRELLGGMMQAVEDEVDRLKSIQFLEDCLTDTTTNKITNMGNDIADTVITPKLRDRFQQEIVKLAAEKVRVEIVRSGGRYGSPQYQIRLFAKPDARVRDILSEGERTCVALAAFLTEVATATHQSAFVFDDPVSSLDHRWRTQVAKRLVEEAMQRQVIVLTHDLIFVNDLSDLAQRARAALRLHTASRGPTGTGVVTEGLPWRAQRVEDRIDKMEKATRAAKTLYESNNEETYRIEAARIYDDLRATWERAVEDVALFRVIQRHRDYIDTKELKKVTVLTAEDCDTFAAGFKKCSGIVAAHDPSSGRNAEAPPPSEILQDIEALKQWVAGLRDRQKKVA